MRSGRSGLGISIGALRAAIVCLIGRPGEDAGAGRLSGAGIGFVDR